MEEIWIFLHSSPRRLPPLGISHLVSLTFMGLNVTGAENKPAMIKTIEVLTKNLDDDMIDLPLFELGAKRCSLREAAPTLSRVGRSLLR
ncbi:hypothetical protein ACE1AT_13235 [Pelatocladus sp. BLCC-F211]|uniref:hypothetical protein n=1 Tax=Pelatocladus sp. BLCC-F211 TaxID=3342752 RepID=UPI0035BAFCC4